MKNCWITRGNMNQSLMLFCLGRLETSFGSSSQDSQGVLKISKHPEKQSIICWLVELSFNISTKTNSPALTGGWKPSIKSSLSDLICVFPSPLWWGPDLFFLLWCWRSPQKGWISSILLQYGRLRFYLLGWYYTHVHVSQEGPPFDTPNIPLVSFQWITGMGSPFPGVPVHAFDSFGIPLRYSRLGLASSATETLCDHLWSLILYWLVQKFHLIVSNKQGFQYYWIMFVLGVALSNAWSKKQIASIVFLTTSQSLATYGFVTIPFHVGILAVASRKQVSTLFHWSHM